MAKAKASARKPAKSTKKAAAKKTKASTRKTAVKSPARRTKAPAPKAGAAGEHAATPGLEGWITHTEFATRNPAATKAFTEKVFGWTFREPFMMGPGQPYHLFAYGKTGGGGMMDLSPGESPRVTPYVHVSDVAKAYAKAIKAGATSIMGPDTIMPGVTLAVLEIPGGIMMGLSGPK